MIEMRIDQDSRGLEFNPLDLLKGSGEHEGLAFALLSAEFGDEISFVGFRKLAEAAHVPDCDGNASRCQRCLYDEYLRRAAHVRAVLAGPLECFFEVAQ